MNEHDQPIRPPMATASPVPGVPPVLQTSRLGTSKPFSWWLQKLFVCNPFYLVSAALLLYGCYRVSTDAPIFHLETARLLFNFSAVQIYEVLLVCTAIFLARRAIWYDSTLLVGLENLLVFVPFILISQAALTDSRMALTMCLAGGTVAVMRFASLKRWFSRLNLPGALLAVGFILLALNIILPLVYRNYGEHIIGGYINEGPAHAMNLRVWMLVLPAAIALGNLLPRCREVGPLVPQHRWLPFGWFSLWIAVTCVHLYSMGYIYQFDFRAEQTTPAVWVLLWTMYWQANRNIAKLNFPVKYALLLLPVFVPLFAIAPESGNRTFLILTALNMAAYSGLCLYERNLRLARHLLFASALMMVAGLPEAWRQLIIPGMTRAGSVAAGVVAYLALWTMVLRNPKLAIPVSIVLGCAVTSVFGNQANAIHMGIQSGLAFLLLHSLRWNDAEHPGAKTVRALAAVAWMIESIIWVNSTAGKFWMPCISSVVVLGGYSLTQILGSKQKNFIVPAASALVLLSGPCSALVDGARSLPIGLLAFIGSFLLFGFGTAVALTRHLWHKNDLAPDAGSSKTNAPKIDNR